MSTSTTANLDRIERIEWAAEQLHISLAGAYRLAQQKKLPGAVKVGNQWRISVPRFRTEVHGVPV